MLRITLNNYLVPLSEHSDLDEAELVLKSVRNNASNSKEPVSFSANITLNGAAFNIIQSILINNPNAKANRVNITIYDDCCDTIIFRGFITESNVDWCEFEEGKDTHCSVTISATADTPEAAAQICLRNKIVSGNYSATAPDTGTLNPMCDPDDPANPDPLNNNGKSAFWFRVHPFVRYCTSFRPVGTQILFFVAALGVYLTMPIIFLTALPILAMLDVVNFFCGGCIDFNGDKEGTGSAISSFGAFVKWFEAFISGCGYGVISPLVRDYIQNACDQCNLQFESSIFTDPTSDYYNSVYFSNQNGNGALNYLENGKPLRGTVRDYFENSAPLDSGYKFLNDLCKLFNAEWWVENGIVHLEPRRTDFPVLLDLTTVVARSRIRSICFQHSGDKIPAAAEFNYMDDGSDVTCNETKWRFDDIVDYQYPTYNPSFDGFIKREFMYARSHFLDDRVTTEATQILDDIPLINDLLFPPLTTQNVLMTSNGKTTFPKLMVWDGVSREYAKIQRIPIPGDPGGFYYNTPYWFAEGNDPPCSTKPKPFLGFLWNLYRFWDKEDPRKTLQTQRRFIAEVTYTCADLASVIGLGVDQMVILPYSGGTVYGQIDAVTVKQGFFKLEGLVIKQQ